MNPDVLSGMALGLSAAAVGGIIVFVVMAMRHERPLPGYPKDPEPTPEPQDDPALDYFPDAWSRELQARLGGGNASGYR